MRDVSLGILLTGIDVGRSPDLEDTPAALGQWGVLKVSAVTNDGFRPNENKVVRSPGLYNPAFCVRQGDLLITRANTSALVGQSCVVGDMPPGLMLCDKTLRLRVNERLAPTRYIQLALVHPSVRRQIENAATGTSGSMKNISQQSIKRLTIPVGSMTEMQRIVEILDAADATIDATRKVAEKLETTASALTTAQLAKLACDAPAVVPLSDVADVLSGVTLGSEPGGAGSVELPYLRVANVQDGRIDTGEMKSIRILRAELPKYLLRTGDVLLTEGGDLDKLGRGAMWDGRIPQCITQNHVFRVRCNESRVLPGYLSAYIGSPMGKAYFLKIAKQTTNLASINSTQLKALPLPVPDLPDQSALIDLMTAGSSQVTVERRRLAKLQTLRHGLMDDLLTGRVRVPAR